MATSRDSLSPIDATRVYPLRVFMQHVGMSKWAMRQARRQGLVTVRVGNRTFVRGQDWDRWLAERAEQQAASATN
ncbi:MAG: hypothetical protein MPJ50_15705 [Pirellulales bacterium]|nr:hypothetical protein [Pirellulales bacterium]